MNAPFNSILIRCNGDTSSQAVIANVGNVLNFLQPQLPVNINGCDMTMIPMQRPLNYSSFHYPHQLPAQCHPISLIKPKEEQMQPFHLINEGVVEGAMGKSAMGSNSLGQLRPPLTPYVIDHVRLAAISQKLKENIDREFRSAHKTPPIVHAPDQKSDVFRSESKAHSHHPDSHYYNSQSSVPNVVWSEAVTRPVIHSSTTSHDVTSYAPNAVTHASSSSFNPVIQRSTSISPNQLPVPNRQKWKSSLLHKYVQEVRLPGSDQPTLNPPETVHNGNIIQRTKEQNACFNNPPFWCVPEQNISLNGSSVSLHNHSERLAASDRLTLNSPEANRNECVYQPVTKEPAALSTPSWYVSQETRLPTPEHVTVNSTGSVRQEDSYQSVKKEGACLSNGNTEPTRKRRKMTSESHSNPLPSGPALKSCMLFTLERHKPLPLQPDFLKTNTLAAWTKLSDNNLNGICLQYNCCNDFKIKSKCLSCRLRKHDEESKLFCRFVGFQILQTDLKSGRQGNFADWQLSDESSQSLWLPLYPRNPCVNYEEARYILTAVFPHFCNLAQQEFQILTTALLGRELSLFEDRVPLKILAKIMNELDKSKRPLWRRVVESTRETCDVCETSIFNMSWSCISCGYIVCSHCYDVKQTCQPSKPVEKVKTQPTLPPAGDTKEGTDVNKLPRQRRQKIMSGLQTWSYCTTNRMEHELRLTQLIPGLLLWETSDWLHWVLKENVKSSFTCQCRGHLGSMPSPPTCVDQQLFSAGNDAVGLHILASVVLSQAQSKLDLSNDKSPCDSRTEMAPHSFIIDAMSKNKWKKSACPPRRMLWLQDPYHEDNLALFQREWRHSRPVLVSHCHERLDPELWKPKILCAGKPKVTIVDCINNNQVECDSFAKFWDGFESIRKRPKDAFWKVKDWPSKGDFCEEKPDLSANLYYSFPLPQYTRRDGPYNLISCLPKFFAQPDLGPKFYMAYGMAALHDIGTTNLHLDVADAVNIMIDIRVPKGISQKELEAVEQAIAADPFLDKTDESITRMSTDNPPGALWHIFSSSDTAILRSFLLKHHPHYKAKRKIIQQMSEEASLSQSNAEVSSDNSIESGIHSLPCKKAVNLGDPVHDQLLYLSADLLQRLYEEENVRAYSILQFKGDCIFIPAGCSHQVRNLYGCVKAAVDFVSPEHLGECLTLTEEFRCLPRQHANQADKLQVKNIIYHTVKNCGAIVYSQSHPPVIDNNQSVT